MANQFPKIIVLTGPEEGKEFFLEGKEKVLIGRSDENDLMLSDTSVSRRHATLTLKDNQWSIGDESSRNGTFVNETRLEEDDRVKLTHLDLVRVGIYDLRFVQKEVSDEDIRNAVRYQEKKPGGENKAGATVQGLGRSKESEEMESNREELEQEGRGEAPLQLPERPKAGRSLIIFGGIAALLCLLAIGLLFVRERSLKEPEEVQTLVPETTEEKPDLPHTEISVEKEPVGETVFSAQPPSTFKVFLDIVTQPLPATIYLGEERLGLAPFKKLITVQPGQIHTLYADFELREIGDVYRKKIEFEAKPDADVVELHVDAEIGMLRVLRLPRQVEFYLEGYYDHDKLKANPVKITDIVYGKPIYLPYGAYLVELREKTKIAGSENEIMLVRYQRRYTVDKDSREVEVKVTDKDLNFFPAVIKSNPGNAVVFYNDKEMGATPYRGLLPLGAGKIKVSKEGYFDAVIAIDMRMNSIYETTVELKTSRMGEIINKAKEKRRHNQLDEALDLLVDALKYGGSDSEKAQVYYLLGDIYLQQNKHEPAMPYFEKARTQPEFEQPALIGLAKIYHGLKDETQALKTIVEVLVNIDDQTPAEIKTAANAAFKIISPVKSVMYVYTEPPGAHVFLNDKRIQQDTPLILSDLGLGNYRLQFEKPGYQTYKTKQNLKVGEFVVIKVRLEPEKI